MGPIRVIMIGLLARLTSPPSGDFCLTCRSHDADTVNMEHSPTTSRVVMERVIAVAALGIALIVMGSIIVPSESPAGSSEAEGDHSSSGSDHAPGVDQAEEGERHSAEHSSAAGHDLPNIGIFEGRRYRIAMFATDVGVRYTVIDATTGETLGELLSLKQAKQWFPDASLWDTDFSAPSESDSDTIMYTDPDDVAPVRY